MDLLELWVHQNLVPGSAMAFVPVGVDSFEEVGLVVTVSEIIVV